MHQSMIRYQCMILCQSLTTHFSTRSIVSQYVDVYFSQSEIHKLQKARSQGMKTRTHISDIDSC